MSLNNEALDIQVDNVRKHFKEVKAVDGVSINIKKGEFVALLGPNGAGKTTLVEMIEGIQSPDSGEIKIKGMSWKHHKAELNRLLGLSFQETHFIDKLRVGETLKLFASFYGLSNDRISYILDLVDLDFKKKSFVENLSGGQRQRLALGIALLHDPQVLLLDEPTTGLDPGARRDLWDILMRLKQAGDTTLILTTHYMEEASFLCERIIIMYKGNILAEGTLDQLLHDNSKGELIEFSIKGAAIGDRPFTEFEGLVVNWDKNTVKGKIMANSIVDQLPRFIDYTKKQGWELASLECRKMTLDDLFINMTGRRLED